MCIAVDDVDGGWKGSVAASRCCFNLQRRDIDHDWPHKCCARRPHDTRVDVAHSRCSNLHSITADSLHMLRVLLARPRPPDTIARAQIDHFSWAAPLGNNRHTTFKWVPSVPLTLGVQLHCFFLLPLVINPTLLSREALCTAGGLQTPTPLTEHTPLTLAHAYPYQHQAAVLYLRRVLVQAREWAIRTRLLL
jgi:hypothetical protein